MALHPDFPKSPHAVLNPDVRWFPADETLRGMTMDKLMPPLVPELRRRVKAFRDSGYADASATSKSLLKWWFHKRYLLPQSDGTLARFEYYFAQREALETIIYLYDVVKAKDTFDMMRFVSSGLVSTGTFDETWRRYVIKMATGTGKTKVMSLVLAWSFFHKRYERGSELSRNFLIIAPNIIVLDRIYRDFKDLRIFFKDPVIPENGFGGRNWRDDFQLTLHLQDKVRLTHPIGNIFLTNIHRVYAGETIAPSPEDENTMDYFLGKRPTGSTTDAKVDLGMIVRDIEELMVLNDEAHHIHDTKLAWFTSIQDIHNRLVHKGRALSVQLDVTATPKHNNGAVFVQTVADYPLVEAISQNVVKHPVLPDAPSRAKLTEQQSVKYTEKYADYLHLGVIEWRKAYEEHCKLGHKAIMFVMTDDTKNCDDVAAYLEDRYPDLRDAVLVIHTKNNGEISETATGRAKKEIKKLRDQANGIDDARNPYKAIVSVLMLKEGWDVRNVTTIVGLRAYSAKSNILPEQTLGRGLRKMYQSDIEEYVSVIGTDAFMVFVESIQAEGVTLERKAMGEGTQPKTPLVIEVDPSKEEKIIHALDIEIPVLSPRFYREYKSLSHLNIAQLRFSPLEYQQLPEEDQREIVFRDFTTQEVTHITGMDSAGVADYRSVMTHFARRVMKESKLASDYDVLYGKMKTFIQEYLFDRPVDLESPNTLCNLSDPAAQKTLIETFKKAINDLTVHYNSNGNSEIRDTIKLRCTRPFVVKDQSSIIPKKSIFNRIIGDSGFELEFAKFLENCSDVASYAKNYLAVGFKLDYVNADGDIANYYPDFLVKRIDGKIVVVETKGREDVDTERKMKRLSQWCEDINTVQADVIYDSVYVPEVSFKKYKPKSFQQLMEVFRK